MVSIRYAAYYSDSCLPILLSVSQTFKVPRYVTLKDICSIMRQRVISHGITLYLIGVRGYLKWKCSQRLAKTYLELPSAYRILT